ncbi:MAG TPA: cobaltochelatase subunit CobN [Solirubrobacteraceae bacterium]|nr:cobaltochelatase subunit CobN [Solirubrobacteraceae bacterium]
MTTADTEILATAAAVTRLPDDFPEVRCVNPAGLDASTLIDDITDGARVVLCRILGGRRGWPDGLDPLARRCAEQGIVLLALGGEAEPDAEMTALSTAPTGAVAQAGEYLRHGDVDNIEQLLRFLADTFLFHGHGFEPPHEVPDLGIYRDDPAPNGGPIVGVCFYRSHFLTGNTEFVDALCDAIQAEGAGVLATWSYSLRRDAQGHVPVLELLNGRIDALITTMLATGGSGAADAEHWDASALAALDVPVLQAVCATSSRAAWLESDAGLAPLDAATQVAIPEFDGRLLAGVISFKERDGEDSPVGVPVPRYVPDYERCTRVARLAVRHARLRRVQPATRRVAVLLTAFPTKHARIGMAVGLDTPASALRLFDALERDGMRVEHGFSHGDELMHALIAAGGHDPEFLTDEHLANATLRYPVRDYLGWYATLPAELRGRVERRWGPPPGEEFLDGEDFIVAGLELGHVLVAIQPPRGYGEDPVGIYHDPELPPTHHYLACYRYIDRVWRADAIVHLGKHGTLEWLPGKMLALSPGCAPDAALGDIPLIYPFVVNDPGEGVQAKRRAHALIVDHLVPPMMRAGTYDELAELETLLDDYARLEVLDPSKLPALASRIWTAIERANLQADLEIGQRPDDLGELVAHIDGYLCEIKDIQIKDGLHILGLAPEGEQLRGLVAAMLGTAPEDDADVLAQPAAAELVERIRQTPNELTAIVRALNGRHVESGPSGAPTRGRPDVLPTGRNFYSVDPRALPSELSWEVGQRLADALLERHVSDTGELPRMIGLVAWGTAAMRTDGDDVAEILALLGVQPTWHSQSRRVTGIEVIPLERLGRPRIDVTVRISGFFRDAFPHLVTLLDDAVAAVAKLDEPDDRNYVAAHARADAERLAQELGAEASWRRATARVFGSKPGTYGAGLLQLLDSRDWRGDDDLAAVYESWGGYAYGRGLDGAASQDAMRDQYARIELAVKNVDSREHDILDSDDYYQYHGGMVATARALSGREPAAYLGDSSDPSRVRTRTLTEETRRVFRARVANPRWIASMIRHGYKGAAELSATVDYLFGYDAMAGVAEDWMYEQVAERYLLDPSVAEFMSRSNPWAARAIAERLLEAADRGMWSAPGDDTLAAIRDRFLSLEGELEGATQ